MYLICLFQFIVNKRIPLAELQSKLGAKMKCNRVAVKRIKGALVLQNSKELSVEAAKAFNFTESWDAS
jgi:hypothetical protein